MYCDRATVTRQSHRNETEPPERDRATGTQQSHRNATEPPERDRINGTRQNDWNVKNNDVIMSELSYSRSSPNANESEETTLDRTFKEKDEFMVVLSGKDREMSVCEVWARIEWLRAHGRRHRVYKGQKAGFSPGPCV
ncbi:hypothetical protein Pcinc_016239 [Petrolisthes cinctipes]|uniref:Uncharacterized protein n=1 Tax=Petrolisthes cinctipes TaxID=88211 RepID=A0AAE1KR74_PETCI|nr:hypothetical protein Pcinc_016239 [Petrolisthes cinctipes]